MLVNSPPGAASGHLPIDHIRYVVLDVGNWLKRRPVLIATTALAQPDWTKKTFHVALTKGQVRSSPDVDTEKPVSRQQEIAVKEYFGWLSYWDGPFDLFASSTAPGREYPVRTKEDSHLRSVWDLRSYEVRAPNGEVGRLEGFILDDASWHLGYLEVKTGDWLYRRAVLVPTRWVKSISWAHRRVDLYHARAQL